jgi:hypothetical protein
MSADSRQALGYGLLPGSAGLALLMLVWLLTSGAEAGGIVLGLLLLFALASPLAAAGWIVLVRGRAERTEEQEFASKRRILDADRLFRHELGKRLRELAVTPGLPADKLLRLAESVDDALTDESAWYDAVQLTDAQISVLTQYDDLVWERMAWLRDHAGEGPSAMSGAVGQLQQAIDQRMDLLVRGRAAPAVAPAALLQAEMVESEDFQSLGIGDAVTYDGIDFVVEALATIFADGQTWKLAHVVPSGESATDHWLSISLGGFELAWLDVTPGVEPGAKDMVVGNTILAFVAERSASVQVATRAGSTPVVLVRTWTYGSGRLVGQVQQWPDGAVHAYGGHAIKPHELEVWPAAKKHEVANTR